MDLLPLFNLLNSVPQSEKKGSGNGTDPASSIAELIAQFQQILANSTQNASAADLASSATGSDPTAGGQQPPIPGQTDDSRLDWSLIASLIQFVPMNQFIPTATQQPDSSPLPQLPAALQASANQTTPETQSPILLDQSLTNSTESLAIPAIPLLLWNPEAASQPSSPAPAPSANTAANSAANTAADSSAPYPPFLLSTTKAASPADSRTSLDQADTSSETQFQIRITSTTVSLPPQQHPKANQSETAPHSTRTQPVSPPAGLLFSSPAHTGQLQPTPPSQVTAPLSAIDLAKAPQDPTTNTPLSASTLNPSPAVAQPDPSATQPPMDSLPARAAAISELPAANPAKTPEISRSHQPEAVASVLPQNGQQLSADLSSSEQDSGSAAADAQAATENSLTSSTSQPIVPVANINTPASPSITQPVEQSPSKATPQARAKRSLTLEDLLKEESQQRASQVLPFGQNSSALTSTEASAGQLANTPAQSLQPHTLSQVTTAAASSLQEASRIQVELNPQDLGRIRVEVTRHEQHLTARIEVAQSHTHRLLSDSASQLTEALASQGITVDRVDINYRPNLTENNPSGTAPQNFSGGARNPFTGQEDGSPRRQPQQEPQQQQFLRRDPPQSQPSSPQPRTARLKDIDIQI